jgi:membrane associated rhomboid family serine protease
MFILFMFGPMVEMVWGNKRFLKYYLLTGIGAAVAHYSIVYLQITPDINFLDQVIQSQSQSDLSSVLNSASGSGGLISNFTSEIMHGNYGFEASKQFAVDVKSQLYNSIPPVIGASGAVFGILLAYGMLFPNSILYLFFAIPIKAKYAVVLFGVMELYYGIRGGDNVAHFAHLGGLVTGLIIILFSHKQPWGKDKNNFN